MGTIDCDSVVRTLDKATRREMIATIGERCEIIQHRKIKLVSLMGLTTPWVAGLWIFSHIISTSRRGV